MSEQDQEVVETGAEGPAVAAEAPEVPAPDTAEAPPVESKPTDEAAETKKALRGVQKRIDELTRAKYDAEQRGRAEAEHWRQQAYAQAQRLQEIERNAPGPKLEQYNDIEQYSAAVARFEAERAVKAGLENERQEYWKYQQQQAAQQQEAQQVAQFQRAVAEKVAAAERKYPDFIDVVTSPELPGLQGSAAFNAILESDVGAEVMYYLGKNPAKAHQIIGLSPIGQVREIGRLEAAIATGRTVSSAPPPPSTINGGKGGAAKDPARMSFDEFTAWRRATIAKRR